MSQLDLFGILGLTPSEAPKAASTAKTAKGNTKSSSSTKATAKVVEVTLPVSIYTGTRAPELLTAEDLGLGSDVTQAPINKVSELYFARHGELPKEIAIVKQLAPSKVAIVPNRTMRFAKGTVTATICYIGADTISLESLENKTVEGVEKLIAETYKEFKYEFIQHKDSLYAFPTGSIFSKDLKLTFPVSVKWDETTVLVTEQDLKAFLIENSDEDVEDEEVDRESVEQFIFSKYFPDKEQQSILTAYIMQEEKGVGTTMVVATSTVARGTTTTPTVPKKETFPTDAVISLLFTKIPLSPEYFGGKKEVERADIVAFLSKDYPEFTEERTSLYYDAKTKFLFPTIKGSTKGATHYPDEFTALSAAEHLPYFLGYYDKEGEEFRVEKTPVSMVVAGCSQYSGTFRYYKPKMPGYILTALNALFEYVRKNYGTEAMAWICYNEKEKQYQIVIPAQVCSSATVHTDDVVAQSLDFYKVAEIHSHGNFLCSFSNTDNEDEKEHLIYGVCINPGANVYFEWRAGTGGRFQSISEGEVFTDAEIEPEDVLQLASELIEIWEQSASVAA